MYLGFSVAPLAYTTRLLFLEGESRMQVGTVEIMGFGSMAMARHFASEEELPRIRLLVFFNRVAGSDLRILRDRRSHRFTREHLNYRHAMFAQRACPVPLIGQIDIS